MMTNLFLKALRYLRCYSDLAFGPRPATVDDVVGYCVDRPVLIAQVRSEIVQLGKLLEAFKPRRSLEIGTNYGGTLLLLCSLSSRDARIISIDLNAGPFGGGYPRRKIPLFRRFPKAEQQLHLIRADSHSQDTKRRVLRILGGEQLDYLFLDGDHTYSGVRCDFEMYAPLVRSGGIVALHDIVAYDAKTDCQVASFWAEIKRQYRHQEIIESGSRGSPPIGVTGAVMETAGLGVLYMP